MTVAEKRNRLRRYCEDKPCNICPLDKFKAMDGGCHTIVSDDIAEKHYNIVFKSNGLNADVHLVDELHNDPVNRPSHYNDGKIEVIDFIEDKKLGFCLGNAVKYISRAGKKDPTKEIEDLNKSKWYIERRIKELQEAKE